MNGSIRPLRRPSKIATSLIEFKTGSVADPIYYRYTDATEDIPIENPPYLSRPTLTIPDIMRSGGLKEPDVKVEMAREPGFLTDISSGGIYAPVKVRILELVQEERGESKLLTQFLGRLSRATRSSRKKANYVQITIRDRKSPPPKALGIQCNLQCGNTFGCQGCFVQLAPLQLFVTASAISGNNITLDDGAGALGPLRGKADGYWDDGSIELAGLSVKIKKWGGTGSTSFVLTRQPPPSWSGSSQIVITPGCDKLPGTCTTKWGNAGNNQSWGVLLPPFGAVYEES